MRMKDDADADERILLLTYAAFGRTPGSPVSLIPDRIRKYPREYRAAHLKPETVRIRGGQCRMSVDAIWENAAGASNVVKPKLAWKRGLLYMIAYVVTMSGWQEAANTRRKEADDGLLAMGLGLGHSGQAGLGEGGRSPRQVGRGGEVYRHRGKVRPTERRGGQCRLAVSVPPVLWKIGYRWGEAKNPGPYSEGGASSSGMQTGHWASGPGREADASLAWGAAPQEGGVGGAVMQLCDLAGARLDEPMRVEVGQAAGGVGVAVSPIALNR